MKDVSRRWFIGGLASCGGALALHRAFAAAPGAFSSGKANLVFGVVSDIHLKLGKEGVGFAKAHDDGPLRRALAYFRDRNVDAVVIPGDIADSGLAGELRAFAAIWQDVFPDDKAPDGHPVERVFVYGNHDWNGVRRGLSVFSDAERCRREALESVSASLWRELFHEDWRKAFRKEVKGYSFFGSHWTVGDCRRKDEIACAGFTDFFNAEIGKVDPKRPFFFVQHAHPKDTCYGPWAWGADDGTATKALSSFPNAVALSGHSHYAILDERSIWQGAFTSIGCGSLCYTCPPANEFPPRGFENAMSTDYKYNATIDALKLSGCAYDYWVDPGMTVSVYDDRMVVERREFRTGLPYGDDWVVPLGDERPFAFAARAKRFAAPEFAPDAKLVLRRQKVRMRGGYGSGKPSEDKEAFVVNIPQADAVKGMRPGHYEVAYELAGKREIRRVAAPVNLPDGSARLKDASQFCLAVEDAVAAKAGSVAFTVTPVGFFGHRGRSLEISSET